jgi:hypothetical protein
MKKQITIKIRTLIFITLSVLGLVVGGFFLFMEEANKHCEKDSLEIIQTKEFHKLRLKDFLIDRDIDRVWNYEYLGRTWFGETYIFSHALRTYSNPFKTKSIALDIGELSEKEKQQISSKLNLDINSFQSQQNCNLKFGEPISTETYTDDRKTFVYFINGASSYELGFTILNNGGLVYFTMETSDVAYSKAQQPNM